MTRFDIQPIGICIHHSATADGEHLDTEAIRRYHVDHNGWDDIGYHAVVERVDGRVVVYPGRELRYKGAHCPPLNSTHFGLCVVGNFDTTAPDDELLRAAATWCRAIMAEYHMPLKGLVYHCDYAVKSCPGEQFPKAGFLMEVAAEPRPVGSVTGDA